MHKLVVGAVDMNPASCVRRVLLLQVFIRRYKGRDQSYSAVAEQFASRLRIIAASRRQDTDLQDDQGARVDSRRNCPRSPWTLPDAKVNAPYIWFSSPKEEANGESLASLFPFVAAVSRCPMRLEAVG